MIKRIKNIGFLIFLSIILSSCSKKLNPIGTYITEGAITYDTLIIKENGHFEFKASDWDNGCYGGEGSQAKGSWHQYENHIHFIIDSELKPTISIIPNQNETLVVKFTDYEGNKLTSRTTIGVNMNNTQVNNFWPRKDKYNDFETSDYKGIHKVMMYMSGSQSYLYIPVYGKPSIIEVSNIHPNVYYEIEDSNFKITKNKLQSEFRKEYANHNERKVKIVKKKYKKIKDDL